MEAKQPTEASLRMRRACIAERLLAFENELHSPVDWQELDNLPDWCAMPMDQLQELITQCGVAAYSNLMQRVIDGRVLRTYYLFAGSQIAAVHDEEFVGLPEPDLENLKRCIDSAGSSILLALISESPCLAAFSHVMPSQPLTEFLPQQEHALKLIESITNKSEHRIADVKTGLSTGVAA